MSPVIALGVLSRAMFSIFKDRFKKKDQTKGKMNIAISFEDGKLAIGIDNINDLNMAVGVLSAALWEMLERLHGDKSNIEWINIFTNDN